MARLKKYTLAPGIFEYLGREETFELRIGRRGGYTPVKGPILIRPISPVGRRDDVWRVEILPVKPSKRQRRVQAFLKRSFVGSEAAMDHRLLHLLMPRLTVASAPDEDVEKALILQLDAGLGIDPKRIGMQIAASVALGTYHNLFVGDISPWNVGRKGIHDLVAAPGGDDALLTQVRELCLAFYLFRNELNRREYHRIIEHFKRAFTRFILNPNELVNHIAKERAALHNTLRVLGYRLRREVWRI